MIYGSPKTGLPETTGLSHAIVINACEPGHKEGDGPQIPSVRVQNELPGQMLNEMPTSSVLSFAISLSCPEKVRSYPSPDRIEHPGNRTFDWELALICPNSGQISGSKPSAVTDPSVEWTGTGRLKVGANHPDMHANAFPGEDSASLPFSLLW